MNGSNVEHEIVTEVLYVILMRMRNGDAVEVMAIGSTSIEECEGKKFVAVKLMNSRIKKTY